MILADIYVPSIDRTYDFQLDENTRIRTVIIEVSEMVGKKERFKLNGDIGGMQLCDRLGERTLLKEYTLADYGITDGASLILV